MFDIGFFEILVVAIVALVVIGPERMPETVRAVGLWIGRLKRSMRDTRNEIERQIGADDIRRQLHNEDVMRSLEKTRQQLEDAVEEGALPKPKTKPKRPYGKEEELPDHAHGEAASGDTRAADSAPSDLDTGDTLDTPDTPDTPDTLHTDAEHTDTEASEAPATDAEPAEDKSNSAKT